MNGARRKVWLSDRCSAQQCHADRQQACLAHPAREVAFGVEAGEDEAPFPLKLWLDRAFALAGRIGDIAPSTLNAKRRELVRQIDGIPGTQTTCAIAAELIAKIARARDQLLTFCAFTGKVESTDNACETTLRPAVIQRKATNDYRAMWPAGYGTAVHTTVDTAALNGAGAFQTNLATVDV